MKNEDFQLEELENAAVKKSNNAKRAAAMGAAMLAAGGAGAAVNHFVDNPNVMEEEIEPISDESFDQMAETGANQVEQPQPRPVENPIRQDQQSGNNHRPIHPEDDNDTDVTFQKTTHVIDAEGNVVATEEEGLVDGHQFKLVDVDGDQMADFIAIDADGNGVYSEDEIVVLGDSDHIAMGNPTSQHNYVVLNDNPQTEPEHYEMREDRFEDYADNNGSDDFINEKEGEDYSLDNPDEDLAEDNSGKEADDLAEFDFA